MGASSRMFFKLFMTTVVNRLMRIVTNLPTDKHAGTYDRLWTDNPGWTEFMLGSEPGRKDNDDFGVIGDIGKMLGYWRQTNYMRVDQICYTYPSSDDTNWIIEAYIEHENDISLLGHTVLKLLSLGAGLKVAISYPGSEETETTTLQSVEQTIRDRCGTNPNDRVLVIFGSWKGAGLQHLRWKAYEFDGVGRHIELVDSA